MQKENLENRVREYYSKVTSSISAKLFKNITENGGYGISLISELKDVACDLTNKFTEKFMSLVNEEGVLSDKDSELAKNVIRTYLLNIGSTTDLSPDEELVGYCAQEIVGLIFFTNTLDNE